MKITKLTSLLKLHFGYHLSRIRCLEALIFGIIRMRTVNLSLISTTLESKQDSAYKRLQRFIKSVSFSSGRLAYLLASIVGLRKREPSRLVLDRTNWKFGKKHINILYLAACRDGLSIPLFFTFLRGKKCGNSNQRDRIDLMQKFIKTFGKKCVGLILGDREFIGFNWFQYLLEERLPFCIRLQEGWHKVALLDGRSVPVKKCFKGLKKGETRSLGLRQWSEGKTAVSCYITGMRTDTGEWVIVAHSKGLEDPCDIYRDRWQIETMFRAMKTGGFNIEDTHVTAPDRLECLFGVVAIAYAICYKMGEFAVSKSPPKLKKHGYRPKSILRYGLDKITHAIARIHDKPRIFRNILTQIFSPIRLIKKLFVL